MNPLGNLTEADFATKVAVDLAASRSNPPTAVPPYLVQGTVPNGLPSGQYGIIINLGNVYVCESRHLLISEDGNSFGCVPFWFDEVEDGWTYIGQAKNELVVFRDYTLKLAFPWPVTERASFVFNVMSQYEFMQRGIAGA